MNGLLRSPIAGKILYSILFLVLLPVLLVLWARATEEYVNLPAIASFPMGVTLAFCGVAIMATGMATLMLYGDGLPMNAYPPKRLVERGIYRVSNHPIYTGFCLACVGTAIAFGSRSGLWLISPIVMLGCSALVMGFEKPDLRMRFPHAPAKPIISLPSNEDRPPRLGERISVYVLVLGPWVILYEAIAAVGPPRGAISVYLPFEQELPVLEWTEVFYASTYFFVAFAPLMRTSAATLRKFCIAGLAATAVGILLFIVIPCVAPPRAFDPHTGFGQLLMWERAHDTPAAAFPSFHAAWAILAAYIYARSFRSIRTLWWLYSLLILLSCMTTGMHAMIDVVAGALLAWMALRLDRLWDMLRSSAESVANSWKEWHVGPVRIINHGIYAGAGTFLGLALIGVLLGTDSVWQIQIVAFCSMITSALWAQLVEGSPSLLRPFGFYGGVVGIVLAVLGIQVFEGNAWLLLSGFAVAGPVIQAMGRLRCLVQGCCHGRETSAQIGIRYTHPRSRVCRLAHLTGVPVYPTPLYSIVWNIGVGLFLARLWSLGAYLPLICGLYLILNGLGRFVEEAYRGEPQTPIIAKLRLYQLMAITSVLMGIVLMMLRTSAVEPVPQFSWVAVIASAMFGLVTWFALGVDFPNSNRRFARLA